LEETSHEQTHLDTEIRNSLESHRAGTLKSQKPNLIFQQETNVDPTQGMAFVAQEVDKIKTSLGSEMNQIQQLLRKQEEDMKTEMQKLISITSESEAERKKAVDEIRTLKETLERQKKEQADMEWEHISRTMHWRNTIDQLEQLNPQGPIKLKTILTGDYYGD
jgi:hypothetical protein